MTELRIAGVVTDSIVDGPGVRYTIFAQGCAHACPGCHNPQTHDYKAGMLVDINEIVSDIEANKYIKGITLSGGEPLDQPDAIAELVDILKSKGYHVLVFSGYTYEQIQSRPKLNNILQKIDVLIDGKFDINLRSLQLNFRGSSNQRIIDVQNSIKNNEIVILPY